MGLEVIAFTVQSFSDEGGVIDNLGIEKCWNHQKDALIAKAKAERERKEEAEQDKLANDKRIAADLEIAQKQNELKLKPAALKQKLILLRLLADAAKGIEAEINVVNKSAWPPKLTSWNTRKKLKLRNAKLRFVSKN